MTIDSVLLECNQYPSGFTITLVPGQHLDFQTYRKHWFAIANLYALMRHLGTA